MSSGSDPLPPPTRRQLHGYEYTPAQQAEKDHYMKQLARDWPNVNPLWQEWVYDFCANTPQEELERMMETGEWDKKGSKFSVASVQKMLAENKPSSDDGDY